MNNREVYTKDMVINILRKNFDKDFKLDLVSLARYAYKLIPINIDEAEYIYFYIITTTKVFKKYDFRKKEVFRFVRITKRTI